MPQVGTRSGDLNKYLILSDQETLLTNGEKTFYINFTGEDTSFFNYLGGFSFLLLVPLG